MDFLKSSLLALVFASYALSGCNFWGTSKSSSSSPVSEVPVPPTSPPPTFSWISDFSTTSTSAATDLTGALAIDIEKDLSGNFYLSGAIDAGWVMLKSIDQGAT